MIEIEIGIAILLFCSTSASIAFACSLSPTRHDDTLKYTFASDWFFTIPS